MKILSLKLRGAIGIMKGIGKEEIEIDFSHFENGLVALTGKNGAGKTTVMENLHPYRCMVSRSGSLQSHFYLKDSYRILSFEADNNLYESKIMIDALTGGSEAYLICNGNPINDGKLTTYDEAIETVLGSQELFFNSVFSGQKSKGIAELKPADRRKLFYELLNLTVYEQYLETAKAKVKSEEIKLAEIEGKLSSFDVTEETKKELEDARVKALNGIADTDLQITKVESELDKTIISIRDCEIEIAKLEVKEKVNTEISEKISQLNKRTSALTENYDKKLTRYNSDLEDTKKLISRNQKLLQNKDQIDSNIKSINELKTEVSVLKEEKSGIISKQNVFNQDYSEKIGVLTERKNKLNELDKTRDKKSNELEKLNEKINKANSDVQIINEVPCGESDGIVSKHDFSSCQFLKNAFLSKESLQEINDKRSELAKIVEAETDKIISETKEYETEKQLTNENYKLDIVGLNKKVQEIDEKLKPINEKLENNKTDWQKLKDESLEAESNVKILTQKMENIQQIIYEASKNHLNEIERIADEVVELNKKFIENISSKINELKNSLELFGEQKTNLKNTLNVQVDLLENYKKSLNEAESQLDQLKKDEDKIKILQGQKTNVQKEITDWTFLTKAFDKTGIPVLKLENSGIEITSIANELLSLFENQFRIVFETTSLTKDKKKMKETFNINIISGDDVVEISNLSGGQQVWVETAIQLAISLLIRRQGKNIKTTFLDEADGALDVDNAHMYLDMLRKGHEESGVHNTFLITHRPELLDLIPQKIKLADGLLSILN